MSFYALHAYLPPLIVQGASVDRYAERWRHLEEPLQCEEGKSRALRKVVGVKTGTIEETAHTCELYPNSCSRAG